MSLGYLPIGLPMEYLHLLLRFRRLRTSYLQEDVARSSESERRGFLDSRGFLDTTRNDATLLENAE
jgi:hypothetical protein